jgi:YggT family protein
MSVDIYSYIIIARIFMSWFPHSRGTEVGKILIQITDPVMKPARKMIPPISSIDFSPIAVIIALNLLQGIFISLS